MRPHLASLVEDYRRHGSQTAVVVYRGNRRYATSYAELALLTGRFSAELARRNVAPGERVVIWGENSAEWIAAFFGCLLRGLIAVPLDAAGSSEFAARVVADVGPKLIVGDFSLLSGLAGAGARLAFGEFAQTLQVEPLFAVDPAVSAETPLQIIFTSGTTSEPKGIVHTHRNVLASLGPIEREIGKYLKYEHWVHPLRFLHSLPLSHVFGQFMGLWVPPLLAAEAHFESQLEPARLIATIRRERISVLAAVPRVLELLRSHLLLASPQLAAEVAAAEGAPAWRKWWRFHRLHHAFGLKFWAIVCGGASLPAELEQFWNTLGFALIQGYGLTETTALVTLNHPFKIGRGTLGKPLPGREVKLGENGEIFVRGEMLSTANWQGGKLQPREQEWLATGDLAAQDASGELRFVGRTNDVIVTASGMNIHVADLESALGKQPGVRACVVVGCPSAGGVEPVAAVVFSGADEELQAAVRSANEELAEYQRIRRWAHWPEMSFPYTATGKLLRRKVAEWACTAVAGAGGAGIQSGDPLLRLIASITGETPANASDTSLLSEDLRLDSLGRVQLQSALEQQLEIELPDEAWSAVGTLGELRRLIGGQTGPAGAAGSPGLSPDLTAEPRSALDEQVYPKWPWWRSVEWMRVLFIEAVMRPLVWLLAAPQVELDQAPLPDGPLLIIANHVSTYDAALVLYALPPRIRRRVAIAMSGEMLLAFRKGRPQSEFRLRLFGPVAYFLITALFNVFPLPRLSGYRRSFAHAGEALDRGYSVLIFPEGHRSEDGNLHSFRPGIGLLAIQSRVGVLPVGLSGLGEIKRTRSRWFRSGKLRIMVGRFVAVDGAVEAGDLTRLLEQRVRELF